MSQKVGPHNISAKIKGGRIGVRVQRTVSAELPFRADEYPRNAHTLEKIEWLMKRWQRHDEILHWSPDNHPMIFRICEAAVKEIDAALMAQGGK